MAKKVGVLGSGTVGQILADGFIKFGYSVMRGTREPQKLGEWATTSGGKVGTFAETAAFADIVVLAVKGNAAESALELAGINNVAGKLILDATNPIADAPPEAGVLRFFTGPNESLMERLQQKAAAAKFVKAFSCVGNGQFVEPNYGGTKPTMFICGNDEGAKKEATGILAQFGWQTADMGTVVSARAIEPMCMLWCILGFRNNEWTHAFHLLRKN